MKKIYLAPFLVFPLFAGCAHYQPMGISSTSIGGQYERPSGMAEGRARRWTFLPCYEVCPVGDDSLMVAVKNALDGKNGDSLANVYVERKTVYFPFPFLYFVKRSEVVVMGTLVKYNTKEFSPDKDYVYTGIPGEMWSQMLSLSKAERARYAKGFTDRNRSMLVEFALNKEKDRLIETGSKDSEVFEFLLLREPKTVTPRAVLRSEASINLSDCVTYDCIITLSPEKQGEALKLVNGLADKQVRSKLIAAAKNRIKACYPDKIPSVVTAPEVQLIYNEEVFLETLCKTGELKR